VKAALERFEVTEYGGIEPNPLYETAMKAVEIAREKKIDFLLAVGGGSVIDATKFIAAAIPYKFGDPWNILAKGMPVAAAVPLGAVLTLPATGSEMNKNSVISRKATDEKLAFGSPIVFPKFSFLLPDAAGTLPKRQVANGIVDAFVHVTEQYLTYPVNAPIQDRFAEAILLTLIEEAPGVYENPADYEAMSNLMWSATMALNGLIQCGVPGDWSVHSIGHELTGLWKALLEEKKAKLVQYAERVWKITEGSDDERALKAIDLTVEFFESLGVPTRLSAYNVNGDTIDKIVARFEDRKWLELGDRGLTTPKTTRKALTLQL